MWCPQLKTVALFCTLSFVAPLLSNVYLLHSPEQDKSGIVMQLSSLNSSIFTHYDGAGRIWQPGNVISNLIARPAYFDE